MIHCFKTLRRDVRGVSAIEFAILLPMLITFVIGSIEVTFKIWSTQKAEKLAVTLSDVVAQSQTVTSNDLAQLTGAVDKIMEPFAFGPDEGKIIITSVYVPQDGTIAKVNWQCAFPPSGAFVAASTLGDEGENAQLPTGFTMAPRDNVIVAEVFYQYEPVAKGMLFDEATIYRRAMFKPRLGALTTDPGC